MAEYIILDEFLSEEAKESADAQGYLHELVRCKDCKYETDQSTATKWLPCMDMGRDGNWFCADGKRKDGEYG